MNYKYYIKFTITDICEHIEIAPCSVIDSDTFFEYVKNLISKFDSGVYGLFCHQITPSHFILFGFSIKDCCKIVDYLLNGNNIEIEIRLLTINRESFEFEMRSIAIPLALDGELRLTNGIKSGIL